MKLYAIMTQQGWSMLRNKKDALDIAKRLAKCGVPSEVRMKEDTPEIHAYDKPTFYVLSDRIASFS